MRHYGSFSKTLPSHQILRIEIDSRWRASEMGEVLISIEQLYKLLTVVYSIRDIKYLQEALIDDNPTVDLDKLKYKISTPLNKSNFTDIFMLKKNDSDLGEIFLNLHYQYSLLFNKPTIGVIDNIYSLINPNYYLRLIAVEYHSPGHFDFSGFTQLFGYIINLYFRIANWKTSKEQHEIKKEEHVLKMQEVQTINAIRKQELEEKKISNKIRNQELEQKKLETKRKKLEYTRDMIELLRGVDLTAGEKRKLYNLMLGITAPLEKQIVNKRIKDARIISDEEAESK